MRTTTFALLGTSLVSSLVLATACGGLGGGDSADSPEAAIDSSDSTQAEGNLMMASMDGADQAGPSLQAPSAPTATQVAVVVAANVDARWPGGCATAVASGADVTITYNDCTGPRGLVHVMGELDVAISVGLDGSITGHGTATGLEVNSAILDIDATGVYSVVGGNHQLTVTSHGSGTGPRGNEIDHDGSYTIAWDPSTTCGSIDGSWSTDFSNSQGAVDRSNDVDLSRCGDACPSGSLVHHFIGGASLTLTFDGSAVATWALSTGLSGTVNLACAAQ